jgi:hypothetical protein
VDKKTLSEGDNDEMCDLMSSLQLKYQESKLDTNTVATALKGSFVCEGDFTADEFSSIVKNWIGIEDDPNVIDCEVEEAVIQLGQIDIDFEDLEEEEKEDDDEKDEVECLGNMVQIPPPTFFEAEEHLDALRRYGISLNLPTNATRCLLDRFQQQVRAHKLAKPKASPVITSFFKKKIA